MNPLNWLLAIGVAIHATVLFYCLCTRPAFLKRKKHCFDALNEFELALTAALEHNYPRENRVIMIHEAIAKFSGTFENCFWMWIEHVRPEISVERMRSMRKLLERCYNNTNNNINIQIVSVALTQCYIDFFKDRAVYIDLDCPGLEKANFLLARSLIPLPASYV